MCAQLRTQFLCRCSTQTFSAQGFCNNRVISSLQNPPVLTKQWCFSSWSEICPHFMLFKVSIGCQMILTCLNWISLPKHFLRLFIVTMKGVCPTSQFSEPLCTKNKGLDRLVVCFHTSIQHQDYIHCGRYNFKIQEYVYIGFFFCIVCVFEFLTLRKPHTHDTDVV